MLFNRALLAALVFFSTTSLAQDGPWEGALRDGNAIAVASAAAGLQLDERDTIVAARVALGAVAPIPLVVMEAEHLLVNSKPDDAAFTKVASAATAACAPSSKASIASLYSAALIARPSLFSLTARWAGKY